MEVQKCYGCGFGFPRGWIDSVTFYLIQPLNFETTEEIFIEASYAFNALVGALTCSLKQLVVLWEGRFYWNPPWSYLMWQLLCIVKELACKTYNLCLDLSVSNTDLNWDSLMENKNEEIQSEEVLDAFGSLCPFRQEEDFLICQDQFWAELCTTGCTIFH